MADFPIPGDPQINTGCRALISTPRAFATEEAFIEFLSCMISEWDCKKAMGENKTWRCLVQRLETTWNHERDPQSDPRIPQPRDAQQQFHATRVPRVRSSIVLWEHESR